MAVQDASYHAKEDDKDRMHVDHCIDYIRQTIECRSDLTPMKLYYSEAAGRMMVDFEDNHTCRDFEAVKDWAWQHRATEIVA
ncbi:hypothetical protein LTR86_009974 [Recurvomyces mirabilis]|nr:hypothetical protein LTR86_009974 [Recurvomyces mirabilis]